MKIRNILKFEIFFYKCLNLDDVITDDVLRSLFNGAKNTQTDLEV